MREVSRRFLRWLLVGCLLFSGYNGQAATTRTVGQLLNTQGAVTLERSGKVVTAHALTGEPVREGDLVTVGTAGAAQILLRANGHRFALRQGNRVRAGRERLKTLRGTPPQALIPMGKHLAQSALEGPSAATLVRGGNRDEVLCHPTPVGLVTTDKVTLRWDGTTTSALTLRWREGDAEEATEKPIALAAGIRKYALPAGWLKPGVWYLWSVTAEDGHYCIGAIRRAAPNDADTFRAMEVEAEAARRAAPDDPTPDLLLVQGYANLGRFEQALLVFAALQKRFPNDAGVAALGERLNPTAPKP